MIALIVIALIIIITSTVFVNLTCLAIMSVGFGVAQLGIILMVFNILVGATIAYGTTECIDIYNDKKEVLDDEEI